MTKEEQFWVVGLCKALVCAACRELWLSCWHWIQIIQGPCPHRHPCGITCINKWVFFTQLETHPYCSCVLALMLGRSLLAGLHTKAFHTGCEFWKVKQHWQGSVEKEDFLWRRPQGPQPKIQNPPLCHEILPKKTRTLEWASCTDGNRHWHFLPWRHKLFVVASTC